MKALIRKEDICLIRFDKGEDFMNSLADWFRSEGISSAAILCGIGMLENVEIGQYDGKKYQKTKISSSSEILSMQGNVSEKQGEPFIHIHTSLAGHDFRAIGGHLFSGDVAMTIELVMKVLPDGLVRIPAGGDFWQLDNRNQVL